MATAQIERRQNEQREPLSRERVLAAAVTLADEGGIDGLSMRKLAADLGVEAMSLYHYFPSKTNLLGAMFEVVYSEMEKPAVVHDSDWKVELRKTAISAHHTLLRHSWACQLMMVPSEPGTERFRWMNSVLECLRTAGFSPELIDHGYHTLDSHIVGFTLWVLPYLKITDEQGSNFAEQFLKAPELQALPDLLDHIRWHLRPSAPNDTSAFDFALDLLLDGLDRLRD